MNKGDGRKGVKKKNGGRKEEWVLESDNKPFRKQKNGAM